MGFLDLIKMQGLTAAVQIKGKWQSYLMKEPDEPEQDAWIMTALGIGFAIAGAVFREPIYGLVGIVSAIMARAAIAKIRYRRSIKCGTAH